MVLEGLKKAEQFVNLLRRAGFQRPDGKLFKADHFDVDFETKALSPALNALLSALQARILTQEEYSR